MLVNIIMIVVGNSFLMYLCRLVYPCYSCIRLNISVQRNEANSNIRRWSNESNRIYDNRWNNFLMYLCWFVYPYCSCITQNISIQKMYGRKIRSEEIVG